MPKKNKRAGFVDSGSNIQTGYGSQQEPGARVSVLWRRRASWSGEVV